MNGRSVNSGRNQESNPAESQKSGRNREANSTENQKSGRVFGYARVSSKEQHLDRQYDALLAFPVTPENIYADKVSGKDFKRLQYKKLMRCVKPSDLIVIKSIDRLGRNYDEILSEWRTLTKQKHVDIVVLDMPLLDTRQTKEGLTGIFIADLVLQILSYVAQVERENIKQRQSEGISCAKARGVRFRRPPIEKPGNFGIVMAAFESHQMTRKEAASLLGVSVSTLSRWLQESSEKKRQ